VSETLEVTLAVRVANTHWFIYATKNTAVTSHWHHFKQRFLGTKFTLQGQADTSWSAGRILSDTGWSQLQIHTLMQRLLSLLANTADSFKSSASFMEFMSSQRHFIAPLILFFH